MSSATRISVVVRVRNEERYLGAVLAAIRAQRIAAEVELLIVDNGSTDQTAAIAARYADRVLEIDDYRPGAALNRAIEVAGGETIAILSGHTLPASDSWLDALVEPLADPAVLAVYGAQIYPLTSRFLDKRDLDIFASPRPREEKNDSDFWNANSAFRRSEWELLPFEESIFELEDHYWTKCQLPAPGRHVRFEPHAPVYHYSHEERNDRTFLPPDRPGDEESIANAIDSLDNPAADWPQVMSAGLTLASLSAAPGIAKAVPALGRRLVSDSDFDVRWRMAHALGRIGTEEAVPYLLRGLADRSFYPRDECAWSLARLGEPAAVRLLAALDELAAGALPFAALALGSSGIDAAGRQGNRILDGCLREGDEQSRLDSLYFAGEIVAAPGALDLAGALAEAMADERDIAQAAHWSWGMLASSPAGASLAADLCLEAAHSHPLESVRAEAVVAAGRVARARLSPRLLEQVSTCLDDASGRVRYAAMQTLRLAQAEGCEQAARPLDGHGEDPDFGVRFERSLAIEERVLSEPAA